MTASILYISLQTLYAILQKIFFAHDILWVNFKRRNKGLYTCIQVLTHTTMKKQLFKVMLALLAVALTGTAFAACSAGEFDKSKPVQAISRESGSGTRDAIHEFLGSSTDNIGSSAERDAFAALVNGNLSMTTVQSTQTMLQSVANNPYQIGYDSLGYCDGTVKTLKYNGVEATVANIKNNTYKIQRPFVIISQKNNPLDGLTGVKKGFCDFLKSKTAQTIVNLGYVYNEELGAAAEYTGSFGGQSLKIVGSTSVQPLMDILAAKFMQLTGAMVTVEGGGSGVGRNVGTGANDADFGMASAAVEASHNIDAGLHFRLATDGIAFIVNKANPLDNLTKEQAKQIYVGKRDAANKYTGAYNWSDFITE